VETYGLPIPFVTALRAENRRCFPSVSVADLDITVGSFAAALPSWVFPFDGSMPNPRERRFRRIAFGNAKRPPLWSPISVTNLIDDVGEFAAFRGINASGVAVLKTCDHRIVLSQENCSIIH
jgi:hypothetical protein